MAKININFNNTTYQIDESALSSASTSLKQHLSTVMNGSGATINFGGTAYNIDSTKLSTAKNEFVTHLGTIAGNGMKVVIGGVEYGVDSAKVAGAISEIDAVLADLGEERLEGDGAEFYTLAPTALSFRSTAPLNELQEIQINGVTVDPSNYTLEEGSTIVTFPIDYLKTLNVGGYEVAVAFEGKTVKGDFNVKAPELNEHGFYYNQPYTATVAALGGRKVAFFIRDDGTLDTITIGSNTSVCTYTIDGNTVTVITENIGTLTATLSSDPTEIFCNTLQTTFKLGDNSIAADDDYIYTYTEDLGGYEVNAIDKTKAEYGAIKTGINGIDTVKLAANMFADCDNMTSVIIPNGVVAIGNDALMGCDNLTSVIIPDSVVTIGDFALHSCDNLISVTIGNGVTNIGVSAFLNCPRLNNIAFTGTVAQWSAITKGNNWNELIPATYVQCSDGQVAL